MLDIFNSSQSSDSRGEIEKRFDLLETSGQESVSLDRTEGT